MPVLCKLCSWLTASGLFGMGDCPSAAAFFFSVQFGCRHMEEILISTCTSFYPAPAPRTRHAAPCYTGEETTFKAEHDRLSTLLFVVIAEQVFLYYLTLCFLLGLERDSITVMASVEAACSWL